MNKNIRFTEKKKIRIHLPEKVKHIHHHKKIYIMNHPSGSQYAPAYLPSAEDGVAVPTKVALPAGANVLPLNSMELFEHPPGTAPSASKLLPLYHTRGYYGTNQVDWDDQNYDLIPPPDATDLMKVLPSLSSPLYRPPYRYPPKRVKNFKVNEASPSKFARKVKPKPIRGKLQPEYTLADDEFPVSSFHHQFYSDLDGSGTIKKVRKPQRVEKFVDGNTEHIHTYSEEHIHKMLETQAASGTAHTLVPIKTSQTLLAFASHPYGAVTSIGSLGTPSHLEYEAYNPRDVTYDHIIHDHGELPKDVDVTKDTISLPPRTSYKSHGLRISTSGSSVGHKAKPPPRPRPTKPTPNEDFTYYENIFSSINQKALSPTFSPLTDITENDVNSNNYRPIPQLRLKDKPKNTKVSFSNYDRDRLLDFGLQQASSSVPSPFSVSNTVRHPTVKQYRPVSTETPQHFLNFKDPFIGFKDKPVDNFEYDTFAASSNNVYVNELKHESSITPKKFISTQNNNFQSDVQDISEQEVDASNSALMGASDDMPSALDLDGVEQNMQVPVATSTPYTIKESHQYYAIAPKTVNRDTSENARLNYSENELEHPTDHPTSVVASSEPPLLTVEQNQPSSPTDRSKSSTDTHSNRRRVKKNKINVVKPNYPKADERSIERYVYIHHDDELEGAAKNLNYGDKI